MSARRCRRRSARCPMPRRSRSACSSSAASGKRTSRSSAASATPTCRSARSPIRAPTSTRRGKGVLLGCYTWNGPNSYEFTAMSPEERVKRAVEYGAQIHPQYATEFENGISVAWHRSPFTLGCAGDWTDDGAQAALRQSLPDRRAHRAGRRTRLLHSGLAGRRDPVVARRDRAPAQARSSGMRRCRIFSRSLRLPAAVLLAGRRCRAGLAAAPPRRRSARGFDSASRRARLSTPTSARPATWARARGPSVPAAIPPWRRTRTCERPAMPSTSSCTATRPCRRSARLMSDDQVAAVVNYVRTHFGNDYTDAVTADDVKNAR